ncbi:MULTISPECIES: hypothetical protein [unclassified Bacillus (in: firmicutes)]|uniref:hypothetical protein n=1 Tax=unclassified Bacillus (in: firmicutes) TaxID=185979 RepID=UPI000403B8C0|nr:hypothetical protein [Bacillus sp. NSP9.1]
MQNKAANRLTLLGISLHIIYWFIILFAFFHIKHQFDSYAVWNPNVTDGYVQAATFVDMLKMMVYSGTFFNLVLLFILIMLIVILAQSLLFIALEITAYIKIRNNPFSGWGAFILAMGIKNIFTNLSGIPFLVAGFILQKEKKPEEDETNEQHYKKRQRTLYAQRAVGVRKRWKRRHYR